MMTTRRPIGLGVVIFYIFFFRPHSMGANPEAQFKYTPTRGGGSMCLCVKVNSFVVSSGATTAR